MNLNLEKNTLKTGFVVQGHIFEVYNYILTLNNY